jgi:hypothetical protein
MRRVVFCGGLDSGHDFGCSALLRLWSRFGRFPWFVPLVPFGSAPFIRRMTLSVILSSCFRRQLGVHIRISLIALKNTKGRSRSHVQV